MKMILKKEANNFIEITTNEIIEIMGETLFFPEDKCNYNNNKLWEGWLEYLTFIHLDSKNDYFDYDACKVKIKEFLNYAIKDRGKSIKFIYSNIDSFPKIVCAIYRNDNNKFYNLLNEKDKIIINNTELMGYSRNSICDDKLVNVVKNISLEESDPKLSRIDDPRINKRLKFFHLQNIKHKMQNDETEYNKNSDKIKECVRRILENEVFND